MADLFNNRKIVIATKHHKEKVIAPILKRELGLESIVSATLDTDEFGTFTGEIERLHDPIETARRKCLKAMELSGCDMAISNEGTFGQHPSLFFVHADSEVVLLMDRKNKLEYNVLEISTETNFNGRDINSFEELQEFAESVLFPSHGIILRRSKDLSDDICKGITQIGDLKSAYTELENKYGSVYAETDMRALYNPTRMKVIQSAVQKLINKIKTPCPKCKTPGFSMTAAKPGLKCDNCGLPTRSTLLHVLNCQSCGYKEEKMYPHGRFTEDPMYCDNCNP